MTHDEETETFLYSEQEWEEDNNNDLDELNEEEDGYWDCAMLPDGTCMKAGSEECDWECPFSR